MKPTTFAYYLFTDERGKRRKTPCRMTAETAATYKDAELIPGTEEVRNCPESRDEFKTVSTWGRYPDCRKGGNR